MASSKIPLFLSVTLMLTHMTAGSPRPIDVLDPSVEENVFPPLESTNGTLSHKRIQQRKLHQTYVLAARLYNFTLCKNLEIIIDFSLHSAYSDTVKRGFIDNTRACQEVYSRLDPRKYFDTRDIFIPRFVYSVKCEGNPSNPPTCGVTTGRMRCLTRMGNVEFMRIPRGIGQCFRRRRVTISDVPVGCYCV
ncbi:hypothetical protein ACROYT_G026665 [Oculina patagonica]